MAQRVKPWCDAPHTAIRFPSAAVRSVSAWTSAAMLSFRAVSPETSGIGRFRTITEMVSRFTRSFFRTEKPQRSISDVRVSSVK